MMAWTREELSKIDNSDELDLRSERADGTLRAPVTMWVVRHGDDLYVRPVKGREGWYRGTQTRASGHIRSGGVAKDVRFVDVQADQALNQTIDDAYRTKYSGYAASIVGSVINDVARSATLKLIPR